MNYSKATACFRSVLREREGITEPSELARWRWTERGPSFDFQPLPITPDGAMPGAQAILAFDWKLKHGAESILCRL